ncbi:MAG: SPFH domain-containing protein [Gemmatimonadales bacterium]|nr:SPFH domain-containing protein [Gemmatimonadales bacterium]
MIREIERKGVPGILAVLLLFLLTAGAFASAVRAAWYDNAVTGIGSAVAGAVSLILWFGLTMVQPNQARVLTLFGRYVGSLKVPGLWWVNPLYAKRPISLRVHNFETAKLKVNDKQSNPIEIGAIVVWQVVDSAEAMFEVESYEDYVRVQSESAVRTLATSYPYDAHSEGETSLSHNANEIADKLAAEVQARLSRAGMRVIEARIAHLAYAPEIANAMLRRQQASAIIAARVQIVEGAVSMVDMALRSIEQKGMVQLDEERKAAMVSNLLVTLCAEQPMQPVVNTGSLY